VATILMIFPK